MSQSSVVGPRQLGPRSCPGGIFLPLQPSGGRLKARLRCRRAFGTAATSEEVSLAKSSGDGSPSRTWPLHQMPPGAKLASSSVAPRRQRPFSSSKCREEQFLVPMANYCYLPNYTGQWRGT